MHIHADIPNGVPASLFHCSSSSGAQGKEGHRIASHVLVQRPLGTYLSELRVQPGEPQGGQICLRTRGPYARTTGPEGNGPYASLLVSPLSLALRPVLDSTSNQTAKRTAAEESLTVSDQIIPGMTFQKKHRHSGSLIQGFFTYRR